jgi:hypothetical protein
MRVTFPAGSWLNVRVRTVAWCDRQDMENSDVQEHEEFHEAGQDAEGGRQAEGRTKTRGRREAQAPSALDAAAEVLKKAGQAMRATEMIAAMAEQGLWTSPTARPRRRGPD